MVPTLKRVLAGDLSLGRGSFSFSSCPRLQTGPTRATRAAVGVLVALVALAPPALGRADHGAVTVDAGPIVSFLRLSPPVGEGETVAGTVGGVLLGARYAVSNRLELTVGGTWLKPARFYSNSTIFVTSPVPGQMTSRLGRLTATGGADFVLGMSLRLHLGGQAGWFQTQHSGITHSSGLGFPDRDEAGFLLLGRAGLEWLVTDKLSVSVLPQVEVAVGSADPVGFTVPLLVSWSWYGLL